MLSDADRFDIVAVRIEQERRIVSGTIVGAQTGTAVVATACLETVRVEAIDRGAIGGAKRHMRPLTGRTLAGVKPQGRFAWRAEARTGVIPGTQYMAERYEHSTVELHARVDVLHPQPDVVVHDDLLVRGHHPGRHAASRSWKI